jgi:perosamine synthetase
MINQDFIPQMRPLFGIEEKEEINSYLEEDGFMTEFKRTEIFEHMISEFTGAKNCIVVNNGTISLTLSAIALGINHGDEVIVPNYTMIATPNSIKMIGAIPVFVDVEPETLILDIEKVRLAITSRTKAIMLVSANGRTPKAGIEKFKLLSKEYGIPIIEDAAQSLGSFYENGEHIGRAGKVGSFSFSAPKIISTGQGGAIITDDDDLAMRVRRLKDFGRSGGGSDIHDTIGYNFKFTELQACLGIAQMRKLKSRIVRKKEIWGRYYEQLKNLSDLKMFNNDIEYCAPWFIDCLSNNRENLVEYLKQNGIGTRNMYPPINTQQAYLRNGNYPVSFKVGTKGLWLPSMIQITNEQIDYVCLKIIEFYK